MDTDRAPSPRTDGRALPKSLPDWPAVTQWPRQVAAPEADFLAVLGARRSAVGEAVPEAALSALLRHSTMLRSRGSDGRFGAWESRSAPAAGGLHGIAMLVLPLSGGTVGGVYDPDRHALLEPPSLADAIAINRDDVTTLLGTSGGTTVQFVADRLRYEACYRDPGSLIWRDSGALSAIVTLVATALSLRSVVIGRHGDEVVRAAGLGGSWAGVGGVHLGS